MPTMTDTRTPRRGLLAAEVGALTLSGAAVFAVAGTFRPAHMPQTTLGAAAAVAGLLWFGTVGYLLYSLDARPVAALARPRGLGAANSVTVARAGLVCLAGGFVVATPVGWVAWAPAVCYGVGVVLDQLDGHVARTVGRETPLGRRLDMAVDTVGFVVAPVVAVVWGQLPAWYLSLSAARYVYLGLTALRRLRGRPVADLPDGELNRYLAGGQMVFLTLALSPLVSPSTAVAVAPLALAPSLAVFFRDYLVVAGHLPRDNPLARY